MFALTSWLTRAGMWTGAGLTDRWLDRRRSVAVRGPADAAMVAP